MKTQRLLIALTVANIALLMFSLAQQRPVAAPGVPPVLRGHALEIVDESWKVRARITVFPRDPNVKMPDGDTGYPETVRLRPINSKGTPNIKTDASEGRSGVYGRRV